MHCMTTSALLATDDTSARIDALIEPVFLGQRERLPAMRIVDVHTHLGHNDPDGLEMAPEELTAALARIDACAAVFPLREPAGYTRANDAVLAAAERSDGRLTPFCRVHPREQPLAEAQRCLARGARGIKLHPYSERFDLTHPAVEPVIALAADQGVPVLVHAGSNVAACGPRVLELCNRHPRARVILAHAAVSDGKSLWDRAAGCPNLFFDLSWWDAAVTLAALERVPPGQLLHASDAPYGTPMAAAVCTLRCCLQAGLDDEQIAAVAGGQAARLLAGDDPIDVRPTRRPHRRNDSALAQHLGAALVETFKRRDPQVASAAAQAGVRADGALEPELLSLLSALASSSLSLGATVNALVVARALALTEGGTR
jgi:predicted TIM-barrel fold metal-dependent hydrolase